MGFARVDFREFKEFQKKLEKLQRVELEEFCEACSKELAARLLAKVIKRTPVGNPDNWKSGKAPPGYQGGTLRRGWTAGKSQNAKAYVNRLNVEKVGNDYKIEIINPVEYGIYVEYGHRTANHSGWVPGQFFLTISEQELEGQAVNILNKKLMKFLGEAFND